MERKTSYIGKGKYLVRYKMSKYGRERNFKGTCENFCPMGLSAFWNEENEQMLLVDYSDIMGLYPVKDEGEEVHAR